MRPEEQHDPGGRVRLALADGIQGTAHFSPCGRYRYSLGREWIAEGEPPRTVLFCGMNPSTADADASDPTVERETTFARDWGFNRFLKVNVCDWRATNPKDLPADPDMACSAGNLLAIRQLSAEAELIVIGHGKMHKRFSPVIERVVAILMESGKPLMCFDRDKDGSPTHPLYQKRDATLIPFG